MPNSLINIAKAVVELPDFSSTRDLGEFIGQVYNLALAVVGILVFIRFIQAGFLYLTAAGNSSNISKANSMMKNAVIGAILLFSAYLILYVINPDLVKGTLNLDILKQ